MKTRRRTKKLVGRLREIKTSRAERKDILEEESQRSELEEYKMEDVQLLKRLGPKLKEFKDRMDDIMVRRRSKMKNCTARMQKTTKSKFVHGEKIDTEP